VAGVAVIEITHQGQGDDAGLVGRFNRARFRTILVQRTVRPMLVIITEVVCAPPPQVLLVELDPVVETFATDGTP
jgi:hypothetical protein